WLSLPAQASAAIALAAALAFPCDAVANGADLPAEVVLQGFAKVEDGRLRLLVRMPLDLLAGFGLPKRGPGYLDLARIDDRLKQAAAAAGRQIELREDGILLAPTTRQARSVLALVMAFIALQAFTLTAAAVVDIRGIRWLNSLHDAGLAAAILLLAIGNLAAPSVRVRWAISAALGALGGFGLGRVLDD